KLPDFSFARLWDASVTELEARWIELTGRAEQRLQHRSVPSLPARVWQAMGGAAAGDPRLAHDLAGGSGRQLQNAGLHNALAVVLAAQAARSGRPEPREQVLASLRRATACDPGHVLAGLNVAEAFAAVGQRQAALEECGRVLAVLRG